MACREKDDIGFCARYLLAMADSDLGVVSDETISARARVFNWRAWFYHKVNIMVVFRDNKVVRYSGKFKHYIKDDNFILIDDMGGRSTMPLSGIYKINESEYKK